MDTNNLRAGKENHLGQKSISIWFTGLSGSGKSTLTCEVEKKLSSLGFLSIILDGDHIRKGLNNNLGFSEEDRFENIRRVAEVSKLFVESGIITLCAFICPLDAMRKQAKKIIDESDFFLVYLDAQYMDCEKRDCKGLYAKAKSGKIDNFTGLTARYEKPDDADLILDTVNQNIDTCTEKLLKFILPKISITRLPDESGK